MEKNNVSNFMLRQLIKEYPWVQKEFETNPEFIKMILFLVDLIYKNALADMEKNLIQIFGMKPDENR